MTYAQLDALIEVRTRTPKAKPASTPTPAGRGPAAVFAESNLLSALGGRRG